MNKLVIPSPQQLFEMADVRQAELRSLESVTEVWDVIPAVVPYGAAQRVYDLHVDGCAECADSPIIGCPVGERLATITADAHTVMVHNAQFN